MTKVETGNGVPLFLKIFPIASLFGMAMMALSALMSAVGMMAWANEAPAIVVVCAGIFGAALSPLFVLFLNLNQRLLATPFILMSIFFAQIAWNGIVKSADTKSQQDRIQIAAELEAARLAPQQKAAQIAAAQTAANTTQTLADALAAAEQRLADATAEIEANQPPTPSTALSVARDELSMFRSQLACEELGPQGASECRGLNNRIIRTQQRPGKNAETLRELVASATANIASMELDHQAAVDAHQERINTLRQNIPELEAAVLKAQDRLAAIATASLENSAKLAETEAKPEIEPKSEEASDVAADFFENLSVSAQIEEATKYTAAIVPAMQDTFGLDQERRAAERADATDEEREAFLSQWASVTWWVALAVAATIDLATQLVGMEYRSQNSKGILKASYDIVVWIFLGSGATEKGRLEATARKAAEEEAARKRLEEEMAAKVEAARIEAEETAAKTYQEQLKASAGDPLETGFIDKETLNSSLVRRLREMMHSSESLYQRVIRTIEPATHRAVIIEIFNGEEPRYELETPHKAVSKFVRAWNAMKERDANDDGLFADTPPPLKVVGGTGA